MRDDEMTRNPELMPRAQNKTGGRNRWKTFRGSHCGSLGFIRHRVRRIYRLGTKQFSCGRQPQEDKA